MADNALKNTVAKEPASYHSPIAAIVCTVLTILSVGGYAYSVRYSLSVDWFKHLVISLGWVFLWVSTYHSICGTHDDFIESPESDKQPKGQKATS